MTATLTKPFTASKKCSADEYAPRDARRWLCATLADWAVTEPLNTDLVVSELVTNAVAHTASTTVAVHVTVTAAAIRIEVHDQGATTRPTLSPAPADAEHGRGLALVNAVCSHWGTLPSDEGPGVWAEIACPLSITPTAVTPPPDGDPGAKHALTDMVTVLASSGFTPEPGPYTWSVRACLYAAREWDHGYPVGRGNRLFSAALHLDTPAVGRLQWVLALPGTPAGFIVLGDAHSPVRPSDLALLDLLAEHTPCHPRGCACSNP